MRSMRWGAWALCVAGLACGTVIIQGFGPSLRTFGEPKPVCALDSDAVTESSGLAPSHRFPGLWYTHNDSGDPARFFRFDAKGKVLATVRLAGAGAIDWEDMASAQIGGRNYLYFGDVGDNARRRPSIAVYRCEEPDADATEVTQFDRFELTYPDGPRNCETLMVHAQTGDLWLVEKVDSGPSNVYRLPAPKTSGAYKLQAMGRIQVGTAVPGSQMTTGGDISADGRFIAVRTYTAAHEFAAPARFEDWPRQAPLRVGLAVERQGEAIAYAPSGRELMTTSEGRPCPISSVAIRP